MPWTVQTTGEVLPPTVKKSGCPITRSAAWPELKSPFPGFRKNRIRLWMASETTRPPSTVNARPKGYAMFWADASVIF